MKAKRQIQCRHDSSESGFSYAVAMPKELDFVYEKVSPELMRQHFDNTIASAIADLATGWDGKFIEINEAMIAGKFDEIQMYQEVFCKLLKLKTNKNQGGMR